MNSIQRSGSPFSFTQREYLDISRFIVLLDLCFLLEEDLIIDENIYLVRVPLFEQLSRSMDGEVSRVAEQILYEIEKRGEMEIRS